MTKLSGWLHYCEQRALLKEQMKQRALLKEQGKKRALLKKQRKISSIIERAKGKTSSTVKRPQKNKGHC